MGQDGRSHQESGSWMMYWWYYFKVCLLYHTGRWHYWRDIPDKHVRLAGTLYYREFKRSDDQEVKEILSEARKEWKLRKRRRKSLLLFKVDV